MCPTSVSFYENIVLYMYGLWFQCCLIFPPQLRSEVRSSAKAVVKVLQLPRLIWLITVWISWIFFGPKIAQKRKYQVKCFRKVKTVCLKHQHTQHTQRRNISHASTLNIQHQNTSQQNALGQNQAPLDSVIFEFLSKMLSEQGCEICTLKIAFLESTENFDRPNRSYWKKARDRNEKDQRSKILWSRTYN
jgi:hypothetical protein